MAGILAALRTTGYRVAANSPDPHSFRALPALPPPPNLKISFSDIRNLYLNNQLNQKHHALAALLIQNCLRAAQKTLALQQILWKNLFNLKRSDAAKHSGHSVVDQCLLHPPPMEWFQAQPQSGCVFFCWYRRRGSRPRGGDVGFRRGGRAVRHCGKPGER